MNLEQQVVSLELAKRLKELGVKQDSLFYWVGKEENDMFISQETRFIYGSAPDLSLAEYPFIYSAFTVAELGEMLPMEVLFEDVYFKLAIWKINKGYSVFYGGENYALKEEIDTNEANARAKMLIYLLENQLITL